MSFDEWYEKYWPGSKLALVTATQRSADMHKAMIAWAAAKDFNPTNLLDLEYICELAEISLRRTGGIWPERTARYRAILRELAGKIPG